MPHSHLWMDPPLDESLCPRQLLLISSRSHMTEGAHALALSSCEGRFHPPAKAGIRLGPSLPTSLLSTLSPWPCLHRLCPEDLSSPRSPLLKALNVGSKA